MPGQNHPSGKGRMVPERSQAGVGNEKNIHTAANSRFPDKRTAQMG